MRTGTRPEEDTVTVRIPMRLEHGGGRKLIIAPDDSVPTRPKPAADRPCPGHSRGNPCRTTDEGPDTKSGSMTRHEGFTEESEVVSLLCHDSRRGERWHGLRHI